MQANVQNTKSKLAKLLATEDISVQHRPNLKTAHFELKNRVLALPIWKDISDDLYDMLVVHEVGHALETPPDGWVNAREQISARVYPKNPDKVKYAVQDFLNVVEDVRIDKLQMRRYPGSKKNYKKGYAELIQRGFFGEDIENRVNTLPFIDRLNIRYKGGAMMHVRFLPEEQAFVDRAANLETWDEVIQLTEEIFEYSLAKGPVNWQMQTKANEDRFHEKIVLDQDQIVNKDEMEKHLKDQEEEAEDKEAGEIGQPETGPEEEDTEPTDDTSGESDETSEDAESEESAEGKDDDGESETEKSEKFDGENEPSEQTKTTEAGEEPDEDYVPQSETERAWKENVGTLVDDSGPSAIYYVGIPTLTQNLSVVVDDYKKVMKDQLAAVENRIINGTEWRELTQASLREFRAKEATSISFMAKEFEMKKKADEYRRTSIAKTGVLDTNKLFSYKYNEDIFRRSETVAEGKNHGFVIFLDWSSSMEKHLRKTVMQLIQIALFCKRVQIPFEVYNFRSVLAVDKIQGSIWTQNPMEINPINFKMRNLLSSRMTNSEFNTALDLLWYAANGMRFGCDMLNQTPLNEAALVAVPVVKAFQARSKVQVTNVIFLTDGGATSGHGIHRGPGVIFKTGAEYVLEDKETKKTYDIEETTERWGGQTGAMDDVGLTNALLQRLKDHTGCNLFGFFIMGEDSAIFKRELARQQNIKGSKSKKAMRRVHRSNIQGFDEARKQFLDKGYCEVQLPMGYDQYFLINTNIFSGADTEIEVNSADSARKLAKNLQKYMEAKTSNRMLLREFVAGIVA